MNDISAGHLSNEVLLSCLDGTLADADGAAVRAHLARCSRCARAMESLRDFEKLARGIPPEKAGADLVRAVMMRTGVSLRQSLFVRAVGVVPYAVAMLVVGGVLLAIFAWSGALSPSEWSGAAGDASDPYGAIGPAVRQASTSFAGLVARVFPPVSASGLRLGIGLGLVLMAVVIVDRFWLGRMIQRSR